MIADPAREADHEMCLPLPSAFKVQQLFQLTKKVVRLVLFALCLFFLSKQGYEPASIF